MTPGNSYIPPPREPRAYLLDIQHSAAAIAEFVAGKSWEDYRGSLLLRSAVERQFVIIGEAVAQLFKVDPSLAGQISEYRRIIDFRNSLTHGYPEVDDYIVWSVGQTWLPALRREIDSLLSEK